MVGPSVIMTPYLFEWGVESLSGSVVADPEAVKFACKNAAGKLFGKALQMTTINAAIKESNWSCTKSTISCEDFAKYIEFSVE